MTRWPPLLLTLGLPLAAAEVRVGEVRMPEGPRSYRLALPAGPARPGRPLVCLFHGHMGSARNTLGQGLGPASPLAAWLTVADREGVVVVALDGARGTDGQQGWNDGRPGLSGNPTSDDVAFTAAVIAQVEREQGTDPARVYAMGMSNGAVFTFRLARELPHPLAALAAACGSMPGERPPAPPKRPVPVLLLAGTADPLMPYGGGQVRFREQRRGAVLGVPATLAYWRAAFGLPDTPRTEEVPATGKGPTRATRLTWGEAGPVVLLRIEGGGHCEPSRSHALGWLYTKVCGPQNRDLEAAEEAWRFFRDRRAP